jgi:hypothetical protein
MALEGRLEKLEHPRVVLDHEDTGNRMVRARVVLLRYLRHRRYLRLIGMTSALNKF